MTGMSESLSLAAMLCARLCHDLSGPLSALLGVVETAREEQPDSEALGLAEDTVVELAQRLKLLRAAWGQEANPVDVAALREFGETLAAGRRVQLDLTGLDPDAVFPPAAARLVLNLLLLAAESLPGGGTVALSGSADRHVLVTIAGPRAAWPTGFPTWLVDAAAAWDAVQAGARSLQGPLTALLVRAAGARLSLLVPAGPPGGGEILPPLLLSLSGR